MWYPLLYFFISSIEEIARKDRYKSICDEINIKTVMMTAHHMEDQAETFLYQLLRGAGAKGLSSMPEIKKAKQQKYLQWPR